MAKDVENCWEFHNCPLKNDCYVYHNDFGNCCWLATEKEGKQKFSYDEISQCSQCNWHKKSLHNYSNNLLD